MPGIELRIVEASGADAAPGDPAEIWVRGDNLFSGYWPDGADGPGADGWYPTGDIGFLDDDGDLTLVDRLRELVIVSGFNVYPFEVEDIIAEVPGVAQVAVVGLPDEETGEAVVAFVVPDEDAAATRPPLLEAVEAHCRTRLARFKQPRASSWSPACRTRRPARSPRAGCGHWPAARPSGLGRAVIAHADDARVVVYTRAGCHLCEVAEAEVAADLRRRRATPGRGSTSTTTPICAAGSPSRCR